MARAWNVGYTKADNASVRKISDTFRAREIDNFKVWRDKQKRSGRFAGAYRPLKQGGDLAELFGVVLGDGSITSFDRTQSLRIVSNADNIGFIERYAGLIERVFKKKPHVAKRRTSNAVNITIYQKNISTRLGIPAGAKGSLVDVLPTWVEARQSYRIRYLRGLYEAEGSYNEHAPTYTYKFQFANTNPHLLDAVFNLMTELGFHPHRSPKQIQLSRRGEVQKAKNLLRFRCYDKKR